MVCDCRYFGGGPCVCGYGVAPERGSPPGEDACHGAAQPIPVRKPRRVHRCDGRHECHRARHRPPQGTPGLGLGLGVGLGDHAEYRLNLGCATMYIE